jgi:hypothetical protein
VDYLNVSARHETLKRSGAIRTGFNSGRVDSSFVASHVEYQEELSVVVVRCNMAKLSSGKNEPFSCFSRRDSGNVFERRSRAR